MGLQLFQTGTESFPFALSPTRPPRVLRDSPQNAHQAIHLWVGPIKNNYIFRNWFVWHQSWRQIGSISRRSGQLANRSFQRGAAPFVALSRPFPSCGFNECGIYPTVSIAEQTRIAPGQNDSRRWGVWSGSLAPDGRWKWFTRFCFSVGICCAAKLGWLWM